MWIPTQKEIEEWLKKKVLEFATKENKIPNYDTKRWLQKYIYSDLHEIFFVDFAYYFDTVVG